MSFVVNIAGQKTYPITLGSDEQMAWRDESSDSISVAMGSPPLLEEGP